MLIVSSDLHVNSLVHIATLIYDQSACSAGKYTVDLQINEQSEAHFNIHSRHSF